MSQFAEPVIPDESAYGGQDPWFDRLTTLSKVEGESSEISMTSFDVWFPAFAGTLSGSRLASASGGLGRDDELRHSRLREEGTCRRPAELNT
jgi:hypothetical protein